MKRCPICGAYSFDDMMECFGCLHSFADDEVTMADRHEPLMPADDDVGVRGALSAHEARGRREGCGTRDARRMPTRDWELACREDEDVSAVQERLAKSVITEGRKALEPWVIKIEIPLRMSMGEDARLMPASVVSV